MFRLSLAALTAFALAVTACSGAGTPAPEPTSEAAAPSPSPSPTATASASSASPTAPSSGVARSNAGLATGTAPRDRAEQLEAARLAATFAAAQLTLRYDFELSVSGIPDFPGAISISGAGASDLVSGASSMSMDFSSLLETLRYELSPSELAEAEAAFGDGRAEIVTDGVVTYMRWPAISDIVGVTTPWVSFTMSPTGLQGDPGIGGTGLEDALAASPQSFLSLLEVVDSVEEVGTEDVRGVPSTHYVVALSVEALLAASSPELLEQNEWRYQQMGLLDQSIPIDIWVDAEGLARRLDMRLDLGLLDASAAGAALSYRLDLFDYGLPVEVTIPPASEVTDATDALFGGGF